MKRLIAVYVFSVAVSNSCLAIGPGGQGQEGNKNPKFLSKTIVSLLGTGAEGNRRPKSQFADRGGGVGRSERKL